MKRRYPSAVSPSARDRLVGAARGIDRSIAVLALLAFISQAGVSIMLPLLPLYAVEIGATPTQLGLMVGAFSVTATIGQLSAGVLATWIPARRQMALGQAVYATGNFLIATTASAVPLIAFRSMAGLGGGLTLIAERLYIAWVAAQERLAFVNGVLSAAGSTGSVIGPLIGAVLALQDLRTPFIVVGVTATIAGLAALVFLPAERPASGSGEEAGAQRSSASTPASGTAARSQSETEFEGAASTGNPAVNAARTPSTGAEGTRWTRIAPLAKLALWSVAFNAAYGGWITTFGPYFTQVLGLEPSHVALYFVAFGIGAITIGPVLARVADRSGRRRMIAVGTAAVFANLATMVAGAPIALIYATAVVAGGGLAAGQASWFALLGVATDSGRRGRSFGLVSALSNLGVILGAGAASIAWTAGGLREGLISSGVFLVLAAASVAAIPSDRAAARRRA
jgi:MFS transporter, DHA1 family, multidrug resistance protein